MTRKSKVVMEIDLLKIKKKIPLPKEIRSQISKIIKSEMKDRTIRFSISPSKVLALAQSFRPTVPPSLNSKP